MKFTDTSSTVLVIDDEIETINLVSEFLSSQNIDVMMARNGMDGINRAKKGMPDVILLDVRMPGMDGFETAYKLKSEKRTQEIPIIFMTGMTELDEKLKAFAVGCVDYIVKPFHESELFARVSVHLANRLLKQELAEKNLRLETALDTGNVVNVAIGILMERNNINRKEAFEIIRKQARPQQRKVAEIANEILAELPK